VTSTAVEVKVEQSTEELAEEETYDQRAPHSIQADPTSIFSAYGGGRAVDIIPQRPITEADAYQQDIHSFPDKATQ
jgi:hypothetical protein